MAEGLFKLFNAASGTHRFLDVIRCVFRDFTCHQLDDAIAALRKALIVGHENQRCGKFSIEFKQ
jgi:hypothetical protein